ncbi:MAG: DUF4915 domain-containing protein [Minisyncoccia bacterium]
MHILVSLFHTTIDLPSLYVFDSDLNPVLKFANEYRNIKGLFLSKSFIYAGYKDENNDCWLLIFSKQFFKLVNKCLLINTIDIHSIYITNNLLYVVSSGTNSIYVYKIDNLENLNKANPISNIKTLITDIDNEDILHLNSIYIKENNDLFITGFGGKKQGEWNKECNGFILNIKQNIVLLDGIFHPHSLFFRDSDMWFCESGKKRVYKNKEIVVDKADGYTRGLALSENGKFLLLGTSTSRIYGQEEVDLKTSGVHKFEINEKSFLVPVKSFYFKDTQAEIYDLIELR